MGQNAKVCVLGAGGMGTAISVVLAGKGSEVIMWTPFSSEARAVSQNRENMQKLPGVKLPESVICTDDLDLALAGADVIVFAVPSQKVSETAARILHAVNEDIIITCFSKGLEQGTGFRMSQVICREIPDAVPVMLSGPCHAEELARGIPSVYVSASESREKAVLVQDLFMTPRFRVYTNPDIIGVELGGALKNVIALCAGISDGLGYGDNTKAALITRGMAEIQRLGVAMGAQHETFSGLTGIGDLVVTCTSRHSRNRRAGVLLGKGCSLEAALDEINMVVEGVSTARAAMELANRCQVEMPITMQANEILFNGKPPGEAVRDLMGRSRKHEMEEVVKKSNW